MVRDLAAIAYDGGGKSKSREWVTVWGDRKIAKGTLHEVGKVDLVRLDGVERMDALVCCVVCRHFLVEV